MSSSYKTQFCSNYELLLSLVFCKWHFSFILEELDECTKSELMANSLCSKSDDFHVVESAILLHANIPMLNYLHGGRDGNRTSKLASERNSRIAIIRPSYSYSTMGHYLIVLRARQYLSQPKVLQKIRACWPLETLHQATASRWRDLQGMHGFQRAMVWVCLTIV